ncbi:hypothetical protein BJV82DRAFT_114237 [Fennellomyces sp. T-0311]|nr:hypothetical protein BJV82DRAFT_114237 [Fennellomyces sp. T-0311]
MQWRPFVLLMVGLSIVFLISLISDPPYPQPTRLHVDTIESKPADEIVLTIAHGFVYHTAIWFQVESALLHGVGPLKTGTVGVVRQRRKPLHIFYNNQSAFDDDEWTVMFQHDLQGPVSKISHAPPPQLQFALMYHQLDNEDPQHMIRVYYLSPGAMHYKDLLMPGTTWIDSFTLENNAILYSRDPDWYRFRIAHLPADWTLAPHSTLITPDRLQNGPPIKKYHQPKYTVLHDSMLSRLYSPQDDTYRVFSLDVHKTRLRFYINITIADNHDDQWKTRDGDTFSHRVYTSESLQYMAFVDGTSHLHQDRVETKMPTLTYARSGNGKTLVATYIKHKFLTFDYTDRTDALQQKPDEAKYLYRDQKTVLPEYFFWADDQVDVSSDYEDIMGMALNHAGTLLAIWTDTHQVYIYKRSDPHHKTQLVAWSLQMVIHDLDTSRVGTIVFWEQQDKNYMMIGLKNQEIQSFWIDAAHVLDRPNFWQFLIDRWNMLTAMSMVIAAFVFHESHR